MDAVDKKTSSTHQDGKSNAMPYLFNENATSMFADDLIKLVRLCLCSPCLCHSISRRAVWNGAHITR